jgi:single-stranded DNA-binding protein
MSAIEAAFLGTLGKNAESKFSGSGKPYVRLNMRVGDGDQAQWVSVMAFDQDAIDAADRMTTGARVYVEGRLSINEWTGKDGAKRTGLSVMSWHCRLAEIGRNRPRRPASEDRPKAAASGRARAAASDYAPIGADSRPPKGHPAFDDDIPF